MINWKPFKGQIERINLFLRFLPAQSGRNLCFEATFRTLQRYSEKMIREKFDNNLITPHNLYVSHNNEKLTDENTRIKTIGSSTRFHTL